MRLEAPGLQESTVELLDAEIRDEVALVSKLNLLPRPALELSGMKLASGCGGSDVECLRQIGKTLGASKVLWAVVEGGVHEATLSLILVDTSKSKERTLSRGLSDISGGSGPEIRLHVAAVFGVKKRLPGGSLVLRSPAGVSLEGAALMLDDAPIDRAGLDNVTPGSHRLSVRSEGYETFVWTGNVRSGVATEVPVDLAPLELPQGEPVAGTDESGPSGLSVTTEAPEESPLVMTWILAGTAVGAAVVGTIFGLRKLSLANEIETAQNEVNEACDSGADPAKCGYSVCDHERAGDCESADSAATIATVSWVAAGVVGAAAIGAYLIEADPAEPGWDAAIGVTGDGGFASVRMRF